MYCPNCGEYVNDGAKFCGKCGATIAQRNTNDRNVEGQQWNEQFRTQQPPVSITSIGEKTLVSNLRSPLFIIMSLLLTISSLISVYNIIDNEQLFRGIGKMFSFVSGFDMDAMEFMFMLYFAVRILMAIGMILLFSAGVSGSKNLASPGSILVSIYSIFNGVVLCLMFAYIMITYMDIGLFDAIEYMDGEDILNVFGIPCVLLLIAIMYFRISSICSATRYVIRTGMPATNISVYVPVMLFVISGFMLYVLSYFEMEMDVTTIITLGSYIMSAITLLVYRSSMLSAYRSSRSTVNNGF